MKHWEKGKNVSTIQQQTQKKWNRHEEKSVHWKGKYKIGRWKQEGEKKKKNKENGKQSHFKSYCIRIYADHTITPHCSPLDPWCKEYYFDSNGLWIRQVP